jgi:hypothetical protein
MEDNKISTKDELIKNFSKEQLEIYNYYINYFNERDKLYPTVQENKEIEVYEKSYKILKTVLKAELVLGLVIASIVFVSGSFNKQSTFKYKSNSTHISYVEQADNLNM